MVKKNEELDSEKVIPTRSIDEPSTELEEDDIEGEDDEDDDDEIEGTDDDENADEVDE